MVWDGRFEIEATSPALAAAALAGRAARLSPTERGRLKAIDPAARRGIPVVIDDQGKVTCPLFVPDPRIRVRSLVAERLAGACGAIQNEAAIWRVAESHATS